MDDELKFRTAQGDEAIAAEQVMIAELLRAATTPYVDQAPDYRHAIAMLMAGLPMYAGHLFALLVFAGEIDPAQQARMAKATARNFREGVKIGLKSAARHAKETGIYGATQ